MVIGASPMQRMVCHSPAAATHLAGWQNCRLVIDGELSFALERRDLQSRRYPGPHDGQKVRRCAERALEVFTEVGDPLGAARASVILSDTLRELGSAGQAEVHARNALGFGRTAGVFREEVLR